MNAFGLTYAAERMSKKQLRAAFKRARAAAEKWRDRNGIVGRNVAAEKAAAYAWELARREL
jgi:hypothetical protein